MRHDALVVSVIFFVLLFTAGQAIAFYEWNDGSSSTDMRGFVRLTGAALRNPDNRIFYPNKTDTSAWGIARLLFFGKVGERLSMELNAYNLVVNNSSKGAFAQDTTTTGAERSAWLETKYLDETNNSGLAGIDRLNFTLSLGRVDVKLGRQPVNFATAFYFTPNDFFAPFSAQTFFRTYKPGVDAARIEIRLGALTQLTFLGVLGYSANGSTSNGYSGQISSNRSSSLARVSTVIADFELTALGGSVRDSTILGGSAQGEIFGGWLSIRAEGHHAKPDDASKKSSDEFVVEVERRFNRKLTASAIYFYHGAGKNSAAEYSELLRDSGAQNLYLGKRYMAIGASYEYSPLTTLQAVAIVNSTDNSRLFSFYSVHSLTDETELSVSLGMPQGAAPGNMNIKSEYGAYPYFIGLELRSYF
ncbi:hypothetical protein MNBD_NITROSPINAE04-698 [hydrothermal vent metagenome]|uniref:Porin domain-containing protein n=1 Tax=hydrothermal vent metagenome TaxID=652676 RepID=A0A3B1BY44_9ZZZZ